MIDVSNRHQLVFESFVVHCFRTTIVACHSCMYTQDKSLGFLNPQTAKYCLDSVYALNKNSFYDRHESYFPNVSFGYANFIYRNNIIIYRNITFKYFINIIYFIAIAYVSLMMKYSGKIVYELSFERKKKCLLWKKVFICNSWTIWRVAYAWSSSVLNPSAKWNLHFL